MRLQKRRLVELNYLGVHVNPVIVSPPWPPSVIALLMAAPVTCVNFSVCLHLLVLVCLCVSVSCLVGPEQWSPKFSI